MGEFDGRVVIVTGAASFIGEAVGSSLIEGGGSVILADRNAEHGAAVAERLGAAARFVETDVASDADLDRLIATAIDGFGRLDGVVGGSANFEDERMASDRAMWQRVLDVNVASAAVLTTKAAAVMRPGGAIVHIASVSGHVSQPLRVVYNVSKAGLLMLVKSAGNHFAKQGIRVNAVSPGIIQTPEHPPETYDGLAGLQPLGRVGQVSDIVDGVLFLESSPFITGEILHIDGGQIAGH